MGAHRVLAALVLVCALCIPRVAAAQADTVLDAMLRMREKITAGMTLQDYNKALGDVLELLGKYQQTIATRRDEQVLDKLCAVFQAYAGAKYILEYRQSSKGHIKLPAGGDKDFRLAESIIQSFPELNRKQEKGGVIRTGNDGQPYALVDEVVPRLLAIGSARLDQASAAINPRAKAKR